MPAHIKEERFESDVVAALLSEGGYVNGDSKNLDLDTGIDSSEVMAFVADTQAEAWQKLVKRIGQEVKAREILLRRLLQALRDRGTLAVLRGDFEASGVRFRAALLPPASGRNEALAVLARRNRLGVYRQARFETGSKETLDLLLSVNGIPVATAELKSPLNGQTVTNAIAQYQEDRDYPRNVILQERCLVHFAVDPNLVFMTTKLAGKETTFLPFNRGSGPGEMSSGKGNPPATDGYATEYLWREVWSYKAWLDILQNFFVLTTEVDPISGAKRSKTLFPRFQQWDAVTKAVAAVRDDGPGNSYLFQHSAGSGKSNTISWLGDRLSRLHDDDDERIFDKVIVITDRRVLDEQLRKNVEQFSKTAGTVETVVEGKGSKSSGVDPVLWTQVSIG